LTVLYFLLALTIVLLPNSLRLMVETGIPGINLHNFLFLVLLVGLGLSRPEAVPLQRGRITLALLGLILVLVAGFVHTQLIDGSTFGADLTLLKNVIFYPLLYFIFRGCRLDAARTRQLIILTLAVAVVAGLEAVYEWWRFDKGTYSPDMRAGGPFGDARASNGAGAFYVIFLPMLGALLLYHRNHGFWRMAALIGTVVLALAVLATHSRQAYLIATIVVFLLLIRRNVLIAVVLGTLMVASFSLLPDSVIDRVEETRQESGTGEQKFDHSTESRFLIWKGAIEMWQEHPGGVGFNRFKQHIGNYTDFAGYDAHNAFMLILAECGPVGLLALMWLFWRLWSMARRLRRSPAVADPEVQAFAIGFTLAVVSVFLGNLFGSIVFHGSVMSNFWILCGLMERYVFLREHSGYAIRSREAEEMPLVEVLSKRFPLVARAMPGYRPRH
jgi:O-antigen ligase